ncbi:MAG: universal stress protein [Kineosporiaceae bacterium]|nr:universal stress protein [Kineosporiaceae bacterium]
MAIGDPRLVLLGFPDAELLVIGARGAGRMPVTLGSTADSLLHGPLPAGDRGMTGRCARCWWVPTARPMPRAAAARFARCPGPPGRGAGAERGRQPADPVASSSAMVALLSEAGLVTEVVPTSRRAEGPPLRLVEPARSVDLVVMGTRGVGVGLVRRFLGGSVATHLAPHAPCSVLIAESGSPSGPDASAPAREQG